MKIEMSSEAGRVPVLQLTPETADEWKLLVLLDGQPLLTNMDGMGGAAWITAPALRLKTQEPQQPPMERPDVILPTVEPPEDIPW